MKLGRLIFAAGGTLHFASSGASAFSPARRPASPPSRRTGAAAAPPTFGCGGPRSAAATRLHYQFGGPSVLISDYATREVSAMEEWAAQYGFQKADGIELRSDDGGKDYRLVAGSPVSGGSTVLYVPAAIVLSSNAVEAEYSGSLQWAEQALVEMDRGTAQRLPLFRLMIKVLAEYDRGQDSPYFPWLNSLPRTFYNGVSMTGE